MPKFKLEDFLLPHEHDGEGKRLEEPKELDLEQLRKWVYGLLTDKEEAQEARDTAITERDQAKDQLAEVQREHENEDQRRKREEKEREDRYAKLEKEATERRKVEKLEEAFKAEGITAERAKRLAKRIPADVDERDWVKEAKELVEDGFRISDKPAGQQQEQEHEEEDPGSELDSLPRPNVRRSDGGTVVVPKGRGKSPAEELDAAGIGRNGW